MNILIVGKGGREHALGAHFAKDSRVKNIFIYPGNPGMTLTKKITVLSYLNDQQFKSWCEDNKNLMNFVFIGPEDAIVNGLAQKLCAMGLKVIAPSINAAKLESSKIFSKLLMDKYQIPTARSFKAYSYDESILRLNEFFSLFPNESVVIKLSGLHAGKGVYLTSAGEHSKAEAILQLKKWEKELSEGVLLEECLIGPEVSLFYFCLDRHALFLGDATDHKRIFDGDQGPNTGGMGCFSPNPLLTEEDKEFIYREIVHKTLNAMILENCPFEGILFVGIMLTSKGPKVLEYNVRFGDPETQTILPLIENGFLDACLHFTKRDHIQFSNQKITYKDLKSIHIVKSSKNYPENPIIGDELILSDTIDEQFYFAGVKKDHDKLFTNGGRVCGLTKCAKTLKLAQASCYQNINQVSFSGQHFRKDIGKIGVEFEERLK